MRMPAEKWTKSNVVPILLVAKKDSAYATRFELTPTARLTN